MELTPTNRKSWEKSIVLEDEAEDSSTTQQTYVDLSSNDLTVISGAALLAADCMGTGILALPYSMKELGIPFGLFFLILNIPINFYAGSILNEAANSVEAKLTNTCSYQTIHNEISTNSKSSVIASALSNNDAQELDLSVQRSHQSHAHSDNDIQDRSGVDNAHTFDFVGLTYALFDYPSRSSCVTFTVLSIYYLNLILVLGNYILVMSHSVKAVAGENICLPVAGLIANILMLGISQLPTMASLGRMVSVFSLLSLSVVVVLCLISLHGNERVRYLEHNESTFSNHSTTSNFLRQATAISAIGFSVGSQKLFLNIRHEFKDRNESPKSLGISLISFGTVYAIVCIAAGKNPPEFLFDAIGNGLARRFAGLMLWLHLAVSFSINAQALCSSMDRLKLHRVQILRLHERHRLRWFLMTLLVTTSSYLIANSVPFFSDLVALIGALTSVPLTLLLPALLYRKMMGLPLFLLGNDISSTSICSFLLVIFSLFFLIFGVLGSGFSIAVDWRDRGSPFEC
jgi:amino acid permease